MREEHARNEKRIEEIRKELKAGDAKAEGQRCNLTAELRRLCPSSRVYEIVAAGEDFVELGDPWPPVTPTAKVRHRVVLPMSVIHRIEIPVDAHGQKEPVREPPSRAFKSRSARSSREPRASQPLWIAAIYRRSSSRPALDLAGHLSPLFCRRRPLGGQFASSATIALSHSRGGEESGNRLPRAERYADQPPTPQFFGNSHFQNGHVPQRRRKSV